MKWFILGLALLAIPPVTDWLADRFGPAPQGYTEKSRAQMAALIDGSLVLQEPEKPHKLDWDNGSQMQRLADEVGGEYLSQIEKR